MIRTILVPRKLRPRDPVAVRGTARNRARNPHAQTTAPGVRRVLHAVQPRFSARSTIDDLHHGPDITGGRSAAPLPLHGAVIWSARGPRTPQRARRCRVAVAEDHGGVHCGQRPGVGGAGGGGFRRPGPGEHHFLAAFLVVQWAFSSLSPRLNLFRDDPIVWRTFGFAIGVFVFSVATTAGESLRLHSAGADTGGHRRAGPRHSRRPVPPAVPQSPPAGCPVAAAAQGGDVADVADSAGVVRVVLALPSWHDATDGETG